MTARQGPHPLPDVTSGEPPASHGEALATLLRNVESVFRGKRETVELAVVALLARGHLLFEDVPGVGKTTLARAIARSLALDFKRVQFTSDMLPSDVIGTTILDSSEARFEFVPGPLFTNVLLADEINRTPPRTQSALLEALNERQVTVDNRTYPLDEPFFVMATQNPHEHHGTYPLPESQMDRFLLRLAIGYPAKEVERELLLTHGHDDPVQKLGVAMDGETLLRLQSKVATVKVAPNLIDYLMRVIELTRESPRLELGVSTRGAIALFRAAQAHALLKGRDFCLPDDIKLLAAPALCHRVSVRAERGRIGREREQANSILREILDSIPIPL